MSLARGNPLPREGGHLATFFYAAASFQPLPPPPIAGSLVQPPKGPWVRTAFFLLHLGECEDGQKMYNSVSSSPSQILVRRILCAFFADFWFLSQFPGFPPPEVRPVPANGAPHEGGQFREGHALAHPKLAIPKFPPAEPDTCPEGKWICSYHSCRDSELLPGVCSPPLPSATRVARSLFSECASLEQAGNSAHPKDLIYFGSYRHLI